MLGNSKMVNQDQIDDCLSRKWIVLAPNHRLCPQVNLLEGPMQDCRDLLAWIYQGKLQELIATCIKKPHKVDLDHVFAFGNPSFELSKYRSPTYKTSSIYSQLS